MALGNQLLQIYYGCPELGAPDQLRDKMVEMIDSAQTSLQLATQQLEDREIVQALLRARARGVRCRIALENEYLSERRRAEDPWKKEGGREINREMLNVLFRAKIPVRLDRNHRLVHSNFIVTDYTSDTNSQVLMTSANLTPNGLDRYYNSSIWVRSEVMARAFEREFDDIWEDTWSDTLTSPPEVEIGDLTLKAVFGPKHQPEMELMKQIAKSRSVIRFLMYTFSASSGIDDALIAAARSMVVEGIIDENQAAQRWAATHDLSSAGVQVRWTQGFGKLHHKAALFDKDALVLGTFNFTESARFSHETIVVLRRKGNENNGLTDSIIQGTNEEFLRIWEKSVNENGNA